MEKQRDNIRALLGMMARIEALEKDSQSYEGARDIERLRKLLPDGLPPCSKYTFTDDIIVQIHEVKKGKNGSAFHIASGAVLITSHEVAFIAGETRVSEELCRVELYLDKRLCVYPQLEITLCQNGVFRKGHIVEVLTPDTEKTLAEKLMEDCELITGGNLAILIPREFLAKLEAEPYSSHPDNDNVE